MVRDRLDTAASAFDGRLEPATFHRSPSSEEALARLEWLLAERQRCGLVVAEPGLGKSHLAAAAARRLGGLGAETAVLSLRGLPAGEWLDLLLARLPLDPASRAEATRPWLALENRLRENALLERPTVLILDDLDLAPADAIDGVARLVAAGEPRFATTCVVATTTPAGLAAIPDGVRQRSAVRIDLPPWSEADVAAFVAFANLTSQPAQPAFSDGAPITASPLLPRTLRPRRTVVRAYLLQTLGISLCNSPLQLVQVFDSTTRALCSSQDVVDAGIIARMVDEVHVMHA